MRRAVLQHHPDCFFVLDKQLANGCADMNATPLFFYDCAHCGGYAVNAPLHMVDAVIVLKKRYDRKSAGAVPGRHAKVLRLEGHGNFQGLL